MKTILLILTTIFIFSCRIGNERTDNWGKEQIQINLVYEEPKPSYPRGIDIILIDSCEYIVYEKEIHGIYSAGIGIGIVHKANCKNH